MLLNNKKMTTIEKIKINFDNFLETRVYNYYRAKKKSKAINSDKRKYIYYCNRLKEINSLKKILNRQILIKNEIKKSFIDLHFLKMLEYFIYLRFYHENIQKLSYNEKLLRYFEKVISTKGFDPTEWDSDYNFLKLKDHIIYL